MNKYYLVFRIRKISWINTIWYLVFRNFYEQILSSIWYSENFHERILFSIRYSEMFHERIIFGIWKFFMNEYYSVFGNSSWTNIFGIRYSVKFTIRCNSGLENPCGNVPVRNYFLSCNLLVPSNPPSWLRNIFILEFQDPTGP